MEQPSFFALLILNPNGEPSFGGAFTRRELAEAKGRESGSPFEVRAAVLE